jgi:hypothetical protein
MKKFVWRIEGVCTVCGRKRIVCRMIEQIKWQLTQIKGV